MIITPPFTEMQKKVIEATEKLADKKKLCDIDGVDDIVITNFDRITASPEALAEFIYCLIEGCDYYAGNGARKISQYAVEDTEDKFHIELIHGNRDFGELLDWLKEEYKNE